MSERVCLDCGGAFEPRKNHYKLCPTCAQNMMAKRKKTDRLRGILIGKLEDLSLDTLPDLFQLLRDCAAEGLANHPWVIAAEEDLCWWESRLDQFPTSLVEKLPLEGLEQALGELERIKWAAQDQINNMVHLDPSEAEAEQEAGPPAAPPKPEPEPARQESIGWVGEARTVEEYFAAPA